MMPKGQTAPDEMWPEYEFDYSTAVRGKHHRRLVKEGAIVVTLEPDIATSAAVNAALRALLEVTEATRRLTARSRTRSRARRAT
jgi:hypothetical protein